MCELLKNLSSNDLTRRRFVPALLLATAIIAGSPQAFANSNRNDILYFGTQPAGKPAFGQTVLITGQIVRGDRGPIANQTVILWFSGRHGVQSGTVRVRTDRFGKFAAQMTIPRSWANGINGDKTWVDVNISCPAIGVQKLFRVRDK
jgi:hypothetical protein